MGAGIKNLRQDAGEDGIFAAAEGCSRGMSASGFQLRCLRDHRLAPLATSPLPAWLWSTDATLIVWANRIGAAIFGAPT